MENIKMNLKSLVRKGSTFYLIMVELDSKEEHWFEINHDYDTPIFKEVSPSDLSRDEEMAIGKIVFCTKEEGKLEISDESLDEIISILEEVKD